MDIVDKETRSRMMAAIKSKNTKPEVRLRKALHSLGFRYILHAIKLPGKPDLALKKHNAVIYVNGCFWHGHDCHLFKWPKTNEDFWKEKITGNIERDKKNINDCQDLGIRTLVVWECALKGKTKMPIENVVSMVAEWLESDRVQGVIQGESLNS